MSKKDELFTFTPKEKTFTASVAIPGYRHGDASFTFKYVSPEDLKAMTEDMEGKPMADLLDGAIADWDVKNDMGQQLPYSREALDALLGSLYCGNRIYGAWLEGLAGGREKN